MDVMTAFLLKIIASVSMLVDHTGVIFNTPDYFRSIGRIAFPIYAYMIAQGCLYTKDINKYLLRLLAFALISEIPFSFAYFQGHPHYVNIFYTLFLGVACVVLYEKLKTKINRFFAVLPALPLLYIAETAGLDYGRIGVGLIFALYLANPESRAGRTIVLTIGMLMLYRRNMERLMFAMVSVLLIFLYNGKQGHKAKWAFYVFYPAHITILGAIRFIL